MSVIIKNMQMPTNCEECGLSTWIHKTAIADEKLCTINVRVCAYREEYKEYKQIDDSSKRPDWCPLEDAEIKKPGWIPVSERLPDKNGCYLISCTNYDNKTDEIVNQVETCVFAKDNNLDVEFWKSEFDAWMPIPEPYREG